MKKISFLAVCVCAISLFAAIGSVGAIEHGIITEKQGIIQTVVCLAVCFAGLEVYNYIERRQ